MSVWMCVVKFLKIDFKIVGEFLKKILHLDLVCATAAVE